MVKEATGIKNNRYLTLIVGLAILVVIVCVGFVYLNGNRIADDNRQYLVDNTKEVAENMDIALTEGHENIYVLATLLGNSLNGPHVDISDMQSLVKDSVFDFVEFADTEGMDHNITGGVSDAHDRQYYLDAMKGNSGLEIIYKSRATHETLFMFYSPVYYQGEIVGSLVGVYQATNKITDILSTEYFGSKAKCYLCEPDGRIVASTQKDIKPGDEVYISSVAKPGENGVSNVEGALKHKMSTTFEVTNYKTGGYIMPLENNDWYVAEIFPRKANLEMAHSANRLAMWLVIILLIIYLTVMWLIVRVYRGQQEQIEAANKAKSSFLFNMSHDIRTPMNAITGYTSIARKNMGDEEKIQDCLEKIDVSSKHLLDLINQVLDMSRIESGRVTLDEEPVNIEEKVRGLMTMAKSSAGSKGLTFVGDMKDIRDRHIFADSARMNQLLLNIMSNAVKYTPEGGKVKLLVEQLDSGSGMLGGKQGYGVYRFTVEDNGIGMSKEFLQHIYEDFAREQNTTMSGVEGTGLGMAIVKQISDLMGGKLHVDSVQGRGTKITFTVPLRIDKEAEAQERDNAKADSVDYNLKGKRVLLVEDNEMNREIARDILEEHGMIVDEAEDGDVAVEKVAPTGRNGVPRYDLVLMDIQMPRLDGYRATKAIRRLPDEPGVHLPIIALSANAFAEDVQKSLEAGMDGHVSKPIDVDELLRTMQSVQ